MSSADRAPDDEVTAVRAVHDIPGRLRLRLPRGARTAGLPDVVASLPGVTGWAWSPRTRSLLVRYRPEATTPEDVMRQVARHVDVEEVMPASAPAHANGRPTVAATIVGAVGQVDRGVQRASGGLLGLGTLLPVALTLWAVTEILRGRTAPLAWSTALWYAHGLFRDYNVPDGYRA